MSRKTVLEYSFTPFGAELFKKHCPNAVGIWQIEHPTLGFVHGRLDHVVEWAINQKHVWLGSEHGGVIISLMVINEINEDDVRELRNRQFRIEQLEAELAELREGK